MFGRKKVKIEDIHIGYKYLERDISDENYCRFLKIKPRIRWVQKTYGFNSPRLHKMQKLIALKLIRPIS